MPDYEYNSNDGSTTAPWNPQRDKIKTIVIEDGVTNIGARAFWDCPNVVSVTIPNTVTSIGSYAFCNCSSLTSITIPNSVTSIGHSAFWDCSNLVSITIPNSVTSIGENAFRNCTSLTYIDIPYYVTSIGEKAFYNCNALLNIVFPYYVTSIGRDAFDRTSWYKYQLNGLVYTVGYARAVYKYKGTMPANTNIVIKEGTMLISSYAFSNCSGLKSITIPNSMMNIGGFAFENCSGLTSITFKGNTPPEFEENVFKDVDKSIPVYVPSISIEAYKEALEGFGFSNIQANPKQLYLTDNASYTQDSQIDGADVYYTRNFTNTNWQALYLPFSLKYDDWKDGFEVARINGVHQYDDNDDGNIDRTVLEFVKMKNDDSVIYPNTPYLIKAKTWGNKTLSVENATVYESEERSVECSTTTEKFIFIGLYEKMSLLQKASGKYYVMDKGNLSKITTLSDIGPYRWYMKRENRNSAYGINNNNTAKEISIRVVGEETTGIANIQHTSPNTQTYDLNGRRVNENSLKPGMYVKNGRKVIVR